MHELSQYKYQSVANRNTYIRDAGLLSAKKNTPGIGVLEKCSVSQEIGLLFDRLFSSTGCVLMCKKKKTL